MICERGFSIHDEIVCARFLGDEPPVLFDLLVHSQHIPRLLQMLAYVR